MNELTLVKHEFFDELKCDIYQSDDDYYMTREQIGTALGYKNPRVAISNIHARNKERLDRLSTVLILSTVDKRTREVVLYSRKGIMEICRWSKQAQADAFIDWVWEVMDSLFTGKYMLIQRDKEIQHLLAESRKINSNVNEARKLMSLANRYNGTEYALVLDSYASKALVGEHIIPLPELPERTYSATEIGKMLGISANKVGRLTNEHGLKTDDYGRRFRDIATHCRGKEVDTFRYFECVIPVLEKLIDGYGYTQGALWDE
jgi:prophage antirepressor-like protein